METMMILDNKDLNDNMVDAFSNDTEFLTPSGWKSLDTINDHDMVAQYDHKDGSITFVRPIIIPVDHTENVYEITAPKRQARQVVSARHIIYFEHRDENTGFEWKAKTCEAHELNDITMNASIRFITSGTIMNHGNGMTIQDRLHIAIRESGRVEHQDTNNGTTIISFDPRKTMQAKRLQKMSLEASWHMTMDDATGRLLLFAPSEEQHQVAYHTVYPLDFITYEWCRDFMMESACWGNNVNNNGHGASYHPRYDDDASFYSCISTLSGYESDEHMVNGKPTIDVSFESKNISAEAFMVNILQDRHVTGMRVPTMYVITRNGERPVISGCSTR